MMKKLRAQNSASGFTLVELMVVVAIIGILAAVAGPRVQSFRARGVQAEAKSNLHSMYLAMIAFEDANDKFPSDPAICTANTNCGPDGEPITFSARGDDKYTYSFQSDPDRWIGGAISKRQLLKGQRDQWAVNTNKALCSILDVTSDVSIATKGATPSGCTNVRGGEVPTISDDGQIDGLGDQDVKQ
jgi:prepilin-type N-terminal cleavage/methylation domain-containing protein